MRWLVRYRTLFAKRTDSGCRNLFAQTNSANRILGQKRQQVGASVKVSNSEWLEKTTSMTNNLRHLRSYASYYTNRTLNFPFRSSRIAKSGGLTPEIHAKSLPMAWIWQSSPSNGGNFDVRLVYLCSITRPPSTDFSQARLISPMAPDSRKPGIFKGRPIKQSVTDVSTPFR